LPTNGRFEEALNRQSLRQFFLDFVASRNLPRNIWEDNELPSIFVAVSWILFAYRKLLVMTQAWASKRR